MAAGHANSDLGKISHSPNHVVAVCDESGCHVMPAGYTTKGVALRTARRHAAATRHTVSLLILHYQLVHPPKV